MLKQVRSVGMILLLVLTVTVQTAFAAPIVSSENGWSLLPNGIVENVTILKDLCGRQTLQGLVDGKVILTDEAVNKMILLDLEKNGKQGDLREMKIHFKEGNHLDIYTKSPKWGVFEASGEIKEIRHDKEASVIKLKLEKKEMPDRGLYSWMVSRFSLGFVTSLMGNSIKLDEDTKVQIHGNDVSVDFKESLANSRVNAVELLGVKFIDCIKISGAKAYDGYIEINTELDVSEKYRDLIRAAIKLVL